jgi:dsRNA-specific ribonuclease
MSTIGGGLTKKIAKHTAAEKLINKYLRPTGFDCEEDDAPQTHDVNCITELMDFCVLKDFHKPDFDLVSSCGPSHAPTFTIECKLNSVTRRGTAGNKAQAKQLAAKQVLDILKSVSDNKSSTMT